MYNLTSTNNVSTKTPSGFDSESPREKRRKEKYRQKWTFFKTSRQFFFWVSSGGDYLVNLQKTSWREKL